MRRALLVMLLFVIALPAQGRNEHVRPYTEGLEAVEQTDWAKVAEKMIEAISFEPQEDKSIRTRGGLVPYVPHFWLGIAYANQEKWDAALQELRVSESQGVIQKTTHYARLRSTKSRIEAEKASRTSSVGLAEARELADSALKKALASQASATSAGASRQTEFRQANQKLQEALEARKLGTLEGFEKMAASATQAASLFDSAARKASAQPSGVRVQRRTPERTPEPEETAPPEEAVEPPVTNEDVPAPVELEKPQRTESIVESREPAQPEISVIPERELPPTPQARPTPSVAPPESEAPSSPPIDTRAVLEEAYRLIARGELRDSQAMLTSLVIANPELVDALVLRGYVQYLQGVLQREDRMLRAAEEDFRAALRLAPGIDLPTSSFSPKAIRFFEEIRASQ